MGCGSVGRYNGLPSRTQTPMSAISAESQADAQIIGIQMYGPYTVFPSQYETGRCDSRMCEVSVLVLRYSGRRGSCPWLCSRTGTVSSSVLIVAACGDGCLCLLLVVQVRVRVPEREEQREDRRHARRRRH